MRGLWSVAALESSPAPPPPFMGSNVSLQTSSLSAFRVVLALIVSASHALALSGWTTQWAWTFGKAAELAVLAFFAMSGFLVAQSFYRSESWKDYLIKRALRIYPAYAAVVLFFFVVLNAAYFESISLRGFWEQCYYIIANLLFLNFLKPSLPEIFEQNPFPFLNGALWTIKIEVLFYCLLPFLLELGKRCGLRRFLLAVYLTVCVLLQILSGGEAQSWEYHLTRELLLPFCYFVSGVLYLLFFDALPKAKLFHVVLLWGVALPLAVLMTQNGSAHGVLRFIATMTAPLLLTVATLTTASLDLRHAGIQIPDVSYSLYLTHFPITQICCALGANHGAPARYWVIVLGAQCIFACIFWKCVERPALEFRNRRRLQRLS